MAWLKNEKRWIDSAERQEMIQLLKEYVSAEYPRLHKMDDEELLEFDAINQELERLERIHRCESDMLEFSIEYFSEARNPGNAGNWDGFTIGSKDEAASFHKEINAIMDEVSTVKTNAKIAVAAPRSHAKSTYLTKAFPLHEVVYRKRSYVIIISETPSVSMPNLEWLATQLKHNKKLRDDFGALLSPKQQENIRDNSAEFIAWEMESDEAKQIAKVEAASTGQALRGRNWQGKRPNLIVCDDLEDAKTNAATAEQRAKLRDWFSSVVMPLGDPAGKKTAIVYMGTTVHFDSLLMNILYKRSDFTTKVFRALIEPPTNGDLWEQCREIYQNYDDKDRLENAESFYFAHKEEMDAGSRVLWEEFQPLWKLMRWKWDNGSKAFNTEYQNNPIDEENMIFNTNNFTYWDVLQPNRTFNRSQYVISQGIDFAMGKKERGDYSAIITVARHRETGVSYVIDAWGGKLHPDKFLEIVVDQVRKWEPDVIGAEAQMAQEFFVDTLKQYLTEIGFPAHSRVKKIYQRSRKEMRIESMLPDIETGKIQFKSSHALLLEQFERYGQGAHDDLPDACEIAIRVSKQARRSVMDKPEWM